MWLKLTMGHDVQEAPPKSCTSAHKRIEVHLFFDERHICAKPVNAYLVSINMN